jgi:hypothetical protein
MSYPSCGLLLTRTCAYSNIIYNKTVKRVKLSLSVPFRHTGKAEVQLYSVITFAPDGVSGQLHAQAALFPVKEPPHIH